MASGAVADTDQVTADRAMAELRVKGGDAGDSRRGNRRQRAHPPQRRLRQITKLPLNRLQQRNDRLLIRANLRHQAVDDRRGRYPFQRSARGWSYADSLDYAQGSGIGDRDSGLGCSNTATGVHSLTPQPPLPGKRRAKLRKVRRGEGEHRRGNARPVSNLHAVTPPLPITRCGICALLEWERGLGGEGVRDGCALPYLCPTQTPNPERQPGARLAPPLPHAIQMPFPTQINPAVGKCRRGIDVFAERRGGQFFERAAERQQVGDAFGVDQVERLPDDGWRGAEGVVVIVRPQRLAVARVVATDRAVHRGEK